MSKMLLNLRNVPDDESDEVRAMLESSGIAWYETRPNRWGFSAVPSGSATTRGAGGETLMAVYQAQRRTQAREELELARREGRRRPSGRCCATNLLACCSPCWHPFMLGLVALPVLLIRY